MPLQYFFAQTQARMRSPLCRGEAASIILRISYIHAAIGAASALAFPRHCASTFIPTNMADDTSPEGARCRCCAHCRFIVAPQPLVEFWRAGIFAILFLKCASCCIYNTISRAHSLSEHGLLPRLVAARRMSLLLCFRIKS